MENNIFSSVVAEPTVDPKDNVVLGPPLMAVPVLPIADSDDVKGCGLNQ